MRCPQCKAEVVADSLFCHKCGERLDQHDPAINREEADPAAAAETPMEKFKEVASSRMDTQAEAGGRTLARRLFAQGDDRQLGRQRRWSAWCC